MKSLVFLHRVFCLLTSLLMIGHVALVEGCTRTTYFKATPIQSFDTVRCEAVIEPTWKGSDQAMRLACSIARQVRVRNGIYPFVLFATLVGGILQGHSAPVKTGNVGKSAEAFSIALHKELSDSHVLDAVFSQLTVLSAGDAVTPAQFESLTQESTWQQRYKFDANQSRKAIALVSQLLQESDALIQGSEISPESISLLYRVRTMQTSLLAVVRLEQIQSTAPHLQNREAIAAAISLTLMSYNQLASLIHVERLSHPSSSNLPTHLPVRDLLKPILALIDSSAADIRDSLLPFLENPNSILNGPLNEKLLHLNQRLSLLHYVMDVSASRFNQTGILFFDGGLYQVDATEEGSYLPGNSVKMRRLLVESKAQWTNHEGFAFIAEDMPNTMVLVMPNLKARGRDALALATGDAPVRLRGDLSPEELAQLKEIARAEANRLGEHSFPEALMRDVVRHEEIHERLEREKTLSHVPNLFAGIRLSDPAMVQLLLDEYATTLGTLSVSEAPLWGMGQLALALPAASGEPYTLKGIMAQKIFRDMQATLKLPGNYALDSRKNALAWCVAMISRSENSHELVKNAHELFDGEINTHAALNVPSDGIKRESPTLHRAA